MAAISVVGEGQLAAELGDRVGLGPQFLGLGLVVLQHVVALQALGVPRGHRGGEVEGRSAGAGEHLGGDGGTVNGHGDGLATQLAFLGVGLEVLEVGRDGEGLDDGTGLVVGLDLGILLEGLGLGGRDGFHHVEVAGLDVGVGGGVGGVDLEGHAIVLSLAVTVVIRVLQHGDLLVVIPVVEHVRTGAAVLRILAEGLGGGGILEEGVGQRGETGVADLQREHGIRLVQGDGEGLVVDDLQTAQLLVTLEAAGLLQIVVAGDGVEEGGAQHGVLGVGDVAPGLGEVLGLHGLAVGELPVLQLDGVLGGVSVRGDGFSDFVGRVALGVKGHQTGEQQVGGLAATSLVDVARNQVLLGFGIIRGDDVVAGRAGAVAGATTTEHHRGGAHSGRYGECLVLHMFLLFDAGAWSTP